jgi:hypothetical protein
MLKAEIILETEKRLIRQFPFPLLKPDTGKLEIKLETGISIIKKMSDAG